MYMTYFTKKILLATASTSLMISSSATATAQTIPDDVRKMHEEILTLDSHIDLAKGYASEWVNPGKRQNFQVDLVKMQEGGLDVGIFIVFVPQTHRNDWEFENVKKEALKLFASIHRMVENNPDKIELALTVEDIRRISNTGKKVALIGLENGFAIGKDLLMIKKYYDLGARYITLTHYGHNDIGDSSNPSDQLGDGPSEHGGLSDFGREVVKEMNRLGIMVDISHTAKSTMMEALKLSKAPVIASHSGAMGANKHPRNLDDEQLRAIRDTGGVAQMVAVDEFVLNQPGDMWAQIAEIRAETGLQGYEEISFLPEELRKQYFERIEKEVRAKWPWVHVKDFVNHIDHAVGIAGIDHVGISSDFEGGGGIDGWDNAAETPNVTAELVRRGYGKEDIEKLWSGNILRVMADVEKVAQNLQENE